MKNLVLSVALVLTFSCLSAETQSTNTVDAAARKDRMLKMTGGMINRPIKGFVALVNAQKSVNVADVNDEAIQLSKDLRIPIKAVDGKFSIATAAQDMKDAGGNAAIFIVDEPTFPMSLVAQESNWGAINVAALRSDNPSNLVLQRRIRKMFLRTAIVALGGAVTDNRSCVMQNVTDLNDLDKIIGTGFEPTYMTGMFSRLSRIGVSQEGKTTYRRACQEGWAPAPTNDYQKAIWDIVNKEPSNPIKITK